MAGVRLVVIFIVFGVASAQQDIFASIEKAFWKAKEALLRLGQTQLYQQDSEESRQIQYGDGHQGWHEKMHKKMREAHQCHHKCDTDVECHAQCPKPWAPFVKACQDFPAIKACHAACDGAACDACPKFEADWMNKKFAKNPEHAIAKAERKCPQLLKAHACHKVCTPGDHECHHKCHNFHGHHGDHHHHGDHDDHDGEHHHHRDDDNHHHHGDDDDHRGIMRKKMYGAHACHKKCGTDAQCHDKCPKPFAPFVKACKAFPAIQACHSTCKGEACDKCGKFEDEWMNEKFAKNPERFAKVAEAKCPMLEKAIACHKACILGDEDCYHKCHKSFHGHHDKVVDESEQHPEDPIHV